MAEVKTAAGNIQNDPGVSFSARKCSENKSTVLGHIRRTQRLTGTAASGETWNNMNNKINTVILSYNSGHKINIHGFMLI